MDPTAHHNLVPEPFLTFKQAAEKLNVPYFKVQRAAKAKLIPTYTFFNKRKLVRISEILKLMEASSFDSE